MVGVEIDGLPDGKGKMIISHTIAEELRNELTAFLAPQSKPTAGTERPSDRPVGSIMDRLEALEGHRQFMLDNVVVHDGAAINRINRRLDELEKCKHPPVPWGEKIAALQGEVDSAHDRIDQMRGEQVRAGRALLGE